MMNGIVIGFVVLVLLWGIGCCIQTSQLKKEVKELHNLTDELVKQVEEKEAECDRQRVFCVKAQERAGSLIKELAAMTERAETAEQKLSRKNVKRK